MNALGIALVWCMIQVSILAGVVVVLYVLARRSGPPTRALATFAGLLLIVVLSGLAFSPWPRWSSRASFAATNRELPDQTQEAGQAGETASDERDADGENVSNEANRTGKRGKKGVELSSPAVAFLETLISEVQHAPMIVENKAWKWPAYVAVLFLIGAAIGLVRLVAGLAVVRSYRLRARRIADPSLCETVDVLLAELKAPRRIMLCESESLTTPATIGWRRPLIILPSDWKSWTAEECRAVLAHEIAHIARHDFATLVAAQTAVMLHFYHPLVHWLAARLRLEQELAADAAAARLSGGQRSYLTTLAGMALRQSDRPLAWPARTFLPTRGTFMRRIEMLRDETSVSRTRSPGVQAAMIAALLMAGLAVAGLRGTSGGRAAAAGEPATSAKAVAQAQDTPRTKPAESGKGNLPGAPPPVRTGSSKAGSDGSNGESGSSATSVEPFSLAYVPRDAVAVAALRPAQLLKHPALAVAKNVLSQQRELQQSLGVSPERIEQVIGVFVLDLPANGGPFRGPVPAGAIVHLTEARDALAMIQALQPNPEEQEYGGSKYVRDKTGTGLVCLLADERTVVVCSGEDHMRRLIVAGKTGASKAKWGDSWKEGKHADAAVLVNMAPLNELLKREIPQGDVSSRNTLLSFGPLWQGTSTGLLTANFGEKLKLGLLLKTKSLDDGKQVKATLEAAITLGQNSLSQTRTMISRQAGNEGAFLLGLIDTVDALIDSIEITQSFDTNQVSATAVVDLDEAPKLFAMLLPAVATARQAAARTQSINNLKQLGLAMHNYAQVNNSFPPAVLYGPDGKTPYSWRVAILPYLDQSALYEQYKKDEPWDSPNNKLVLAKMPALFRDPGAPADSTNSSYFAVTGPATIFSGKEGAKFADITDGMSNTLMLVEAKRDIPWTKPEDIPYPAAAPGGPAGGITNGQPEKSKTKDAPEAVDAPLPKLGGHYADIFLAAMCDGSVRAFPQKINPIILRSMLTRAAGEAIDWSTVNDPGAAKNP